MAGYFHLKHASNGQWMFNLKAANHEVILSSETYSSKTAAYDGIASVRSNASHDRAYHRKVAGDGSPYFVLTSTANGQTLGTSEMYSSTTAMETGIASVRLNAPTASVLADP